VSHEEEYEQEDHEAAQRPRRDDAKDGAGDSFAREEGGLGEDVAASHEPDAADGVALGDRRGKGAEEGDLELGLVREVGARDRDQRILTDGRDGALGAVADGGAAESVAGPSEGFPAEAGEAVLEEAEGLGVGVGTVEHDGDELPVVFGGGGDAAVARLLDKAGLDAVHEGSALE